MQQKIKLIINNENNPGYYLNYHNPVLSPLMDKFINILWNKYYKLFKTDNIYNEPFKFINNINNLYYVSNNDNNKLKYIYKHKFDNFIKYYTLFHNYNYLLNKDNTLIITQNSLSLGHIESLSFLNKKKTDILRFINFNIVDEEKMNKIDKLYKSFSKNINKIIIEKNKPNLDIIKKIDKKYDLIIFDLTNWLNISTEFLEISNSNLIYYAFITSLNLLNKNGNLIISMGINTKFSVDILLLINKYFDDVILDDTYSINFMNNQLYKIEVIFKGFKDNLKKDVFKNELKNLETIFNKLIEINKTSHDFNILNYILRTNFYILKGKKDNGSNSIYSHPNSLLNINIISKKFNIIKKFNINLFKKKIDKIKLIIKYFKKIPNKYKEKQIKESTEYLINIGLIKSDQYFKDNIENQKTYLILSKYIQPSLFKKYLPDNWKEVNKYTKNIDFVYVDAYYRSFKDIEKYNINYLSKVEYIKYDFDDKDYLHKYIAKDNPNIFKKYFLEQHKIDKNNIKKYSKLFEKKKGDKPLWIIKPVPGSLGFGIIVVNSLELMEKHIKNFKLKHHGETPVKKWVIQKYIEDPLLFKGKKFHIRINIMNGILNGEKFSKIINLFKIIVAKKKYNKKDFTDVDIHDTHCHDRIELLKDFNNIFKKEYGKKITDKILKKINILHNYLKKIINIKCYSYSNNCYQFYGIDIIITKKLQIKCLELNMTPAILLQNNKDKEYIVKTILENMRII